MSQQLKHIWNILQVTYSTDKAGFNTSINQFVHVEADYKQDLNKFGNKAYLPRQFPEFSNRATF